MSEYDKSPKGFFVPLPARVKARFATQVIDADTVCREREFAWWANLVLQFDPYNGGGAMWPHT